MDSHTKEKPNKYAVALVLILSLGGIFYVFQRVPAPEVVLGTVEEIVSTSSSTLDPELGVGTLKEQELRVTIESGTIKVQNDFREVRPGDRVFVKQSIFEGRGFEVVDISRTRELVFLALVFVVLVFLTSGGKGFYSLVGLLWSFAVIFVFLVPKILGGSDPVLFGLLAAAFILAPTLYLSYGLNKKSIAAFLGVVAALLFTGILANFMINTAQFSGMSEAATFLSIESSTAINLIGLLIAGIIIAAVGVLDDVAAVQASAVIALAEADEKLRGLRLFKKAMAVGRDHISAVVNTLILAYTGAALPLVLLFSLRKMPVGYFLSMEMVSEEIIRTLVASTGLLVAVPMTTLIAVLMVGEKLLEGEVK